VLGCRDLPYPVGYLPFPVAQLVNWIVHLPRPLGDEYGQVAVFADDQVVRETAVEFPTSVYETPLYLFSTHRPPPSLGSCVAANLCQQRSDTTTTLSPRSLEQEMGRSPSASSVVSSGSSMTTGTLYSRFGAGARSAPWCRVRTTWSRLPLCR